jgi:predicted enzyme related to lactoylglutathione lyase
MAAGPAKTNFMENQKHPTFADGKICYLVIPAIDVEASAAFYESVFGWNIRRRGAGDISFDDSAGEVSGAWATGMTPQPDAGISIHIMVYDMKASLEKIVAHGGKITEQVDPNASEVTAKFRDPAGNIFGLYQSHQSER